VTIPAQARRELGLDQPGAQVEVVLRDGELVLVPYVAVPAETAWFWREGHRRPSERLTLISPPVGRPTSTPPSNFWPISGTCTARPKGEISNDLGVRS
jgi:AbrB family looped-hinge helix DNA binding protein